MKIAIYGIDDFVMGKQRVPDERLEKLKEIFHPPKVVYSQIEFVDEASLKEAQTIVCLDSRKDELVVMDLEYIDDRINRITDEKEKQVLASFQDELNKGNFLSQINFSDDQKQVAGDLSFISTKPILLVSQEELQDNADIIRRAFYHSGMICFFTVGGKELKSWSLKKGLSAHEAAGCIHSDIQRGFIKAEIISYEDLIASGGENQAKARGLMRLEDKDYIIKDADAVNFRFNV